MMLGGIGWPSFKREPQWQWTQNSACGPYGQNWVPMAAGKGPGLCLPDGMQPFDRAIVLWAYERAFVAGQQEGANALRVQFKRLMELDGFK